jgi:hypothetical protein
MTPSAACAATSACLASRGRQAHNVIDIRLAGGAPCACSSTVAASRCSLWWNGTTSYAEFRVPNRRSGATADPGRDGRRRPPFVLGRASHRRLPAPCLARKAGLRRTGRVPRPAFGDSQHRYRGVGEPLRALVSRRAGSRCPREGGECSALSVVPVAVGELVSAEPTAPAVRADPGARRTSRVRAWKTGQYGS